MATDMKYQTGFCTIGLHEGTKPRSAVENKPMKVCEFWQQCGCDCHTQITKMMEMVGQERLPMPNPEYVPYHRNFWMPSDEPDYMPLAAPEVTETEGVVLPEREVVATHTGRTQRGGLEFWVQRECLAWLVDRDPTYCTIKYLVQEIARVEGIAPPSAGAIAAVFDRWVKFGYAVIADDRPRRFTGLTEQGAKMGLDWCRANYKKQQHV